MATTTTRLAGRPGRPPLPAAQRKRESLIVPVTARLKGRVQHAADVAGVSMAEYVRRIIHAALEEQC